MSTASICCPFCGEDDFDLGGLRDHLKFGWCEEFDKIETDETDAPPAPANRSEGGRNV